MKFSWEFNLMKGKNPQHTAAFLNGYDERNFESEEIAARESGQNSVDAGRDIDQKTTELVFQEISLNKEKKDEFLKLINFDLDQKLTFNLNLFSNNQYLLLIDFICGV